MKHDRKERRGRRNNPKNRDQSGRRKKFILIAAAVVLVGVIIALVYLKQHPSESMMAGGNAAAGGQSGKNGSQTGSGTDMENGSGTDDGKREGDGTAQEGFMPGGVGSLNVVPDIVIDLDKEPGDQTAESVEFPYSIEGTELTVDKITQYDGIFIEDGSDEEISGVSAMVLTNRGKTDVEYAEVTAQQSDRALSFKASAIPAGATVVVLEAAQTGWSDEAVTQIYASASDGSSFEMSGDQIQIEDNGDDSITVTNISDKEIPCVRFFYKYKMEENIYVGGIAYVAKLTGLDAGESQTVRPSHYVSGSSEVLMARTYETAD